MAQKKQSQNQTVIIQKPDTVQQQIAQLIGQINELTKAITKLTDENTALRAENKKAHDTIAYLTKKLYGASSEKTIAIDKDQLSFLFDEAEQEVHPKEPEPTIEAAEKVIRKKRTTGHKEKSLKDLPHEKRLYRLAEEERICPLCGAALKTMGEVFVRSEVEYIPARCCVIDIYKETCECRECRKEERPYIISVPTPTPVIKHSIASPTSIAWVMHQKFEQHLPLYRQEKEWESIGLRLTRANMANWMIIASRDWLTPLLMRMKGQMKQEGYLHADETPVQVLNEPERKNTTKSYMWVYSTISDSKRPIRIFEYKPGRGGKYPREFLRGFTGYLHTDAYSGYENLSGVTRCLCWAHLRRTFVDALPKDMHSPEATIPAKAIAYCNKLFKIEKSLESSSANDRKAQRLEQEKPVLEAFWSWIEEEGKNVLPKSGLGKAFAYAINQKQGLMNYLEDGHCAISNNLAENSIRPFTIGRKNWLFAGSPKGAEASAAIYSTVETAKANGLNAYSYLEYIFSAMPGMDFKKQPELLDRLMPWHPNIQNICAKNKNENQK